MKTLFFISAALIFYIYILYPVLIFALAKLSRKKTLQAPFQGTVSVVMAVHNAEHLLPEQLNRLASFPESLIQEIIVVSDGSTDSTVTLLTNADDPRIQSIILTEHQGKSEALNRGISRATSDIVFFVDARPHFSIDALEQLLSNFADPSVGCVTGELSLKTLGHDGAASAVSGLYWKYEQWIRFNEAGWDSPLGVYGGFYVVRKELLEPFPKGLILDDMYQPLSIVAKGYRSIIDRNAYVTDVWPAKMDDEFRRKVRTLAGNFQLIACCSWLLTLKNRLLVQFLSHKIGRLVAPYFFLCTLAASTVLACTSAGWVYVALMQCIFWGIAALSLRIRIPFVHRIGAAAGAFLALNCAAVAGLKTFLFVDGPLHKIWVASPPSTPSSLEKRG